jgi:hypothetical protein
VTNLAIVVGVSVYQSAADLPACIPDASAVARLLQSSTKFDDILTLSGTLTSRRTKEGLVNFVSKHKGSEISDVLYYYTGHGDLIGDEFFT